MKVSRARLALVAALAASLGCATDKGGVAGVLVVAIVEVTPGITSVVVGTTTTLTAAPKTASGLSVPGRTVTWSSLSPGIATVTSGGVVSGVTVGGPVTIRATVDGVPGDALVTVHAVPVGRVTVSPPTNPVVAGQSVQLTAAAFDAGGAPLSGRSFLWQSSEPSVAAVTTTGMVLAVSAGGPVTISATSEGQTGTATVTVAPRPADRLGFAQQPTTSTAGAPFNPTIKVAVQDNLLGTVLTATHPVTIALAVNPGNATLSGTTTVNAVNGIATFGDLTLNRVGAGYTFLVQSAGLTAATSVPFNITPGTAGRLAFATPPPATAQSGVVFTTQPVVQLVDADGNTVAQAGVVVTATLVLGTGTLGGTVTAITNTSGTASFTNLAITGLAGSYSLGFGAPGVTSVNSAAIALTAGPAALLSIAAQPSSTAQNGFPLAQQPRVQLLDAAGNPVPQGGTVVTAALASGTGTLGGATSTTTNAAGLASFASLAINGGAGAYTLRFSAPGLTPVVSDPITLGAGAPTQITMTVQPSSTAQVGVPFAQQPSVQLRDASNNPVAVAGVTITATTSAGGVVQGPATAVTNSTGLAAFSSLALFGAVGNYTLTFSSSGLAPGTSDPIALLTGAAAQLGVTTQPSAAGVQSGVAFAQQPVVQVQDAAGNPVAAVGISVVAAITGPAGGVLSGTLSVPTSPSGAAAFGDLKITGPSGAYTLRFTATGLTPVASNPVTLGSGAATTIAANSATSQTAIAGSAVAAPPSVKVTDASANPVAGIPVTFTVTAGGGSVLPAAPVLTDGSGIATATSWTLGVTAGTNNNTLTATAAVPNGSPVTFTASGLVGPANTIAANSVTSQSATVSTAVTAPPSVKVTDANNNPVANVSVTFTVTAGGGTTGPTSPATVTTNALGVASLTSWILGSVAGTNNNTVTATAAVPTGSPVTFTASGTAAAAGSIAANSPTSLTATVNTNVATPPSVKVTDAATNPVPNVAVTFTVTAGGGSTVPVQVAVVNTDALGVASLTSWKLGTVAGTNNNTLTATAGPLGPVTFTATATAGSANQVAANSVTSQSAQVGTAVGAPPKVKVTDQFGNPVSGFAVSFAVTAGGGTVVPAAPTTVATDVNGIAATTSWTLGPSAGANTVRATAGSLIGSPIDFSATGTAGSATNIAANSVTSQSATAGSAVATPPSVKVTDGIGNPVQGVMVTFAVTAGGGSITGPAAVATNVSGVATVGGWTLGPTAGTSNNTLTATSAGLTGSPVTFTASGLVGPANLIAANSVTSQSATVSTAVTAPPSVKVTDANNNPVANVSVTFTVTAGGGTSGPASPATVNTNALGIASLTSWILGSGAGTNNNTVTATAAVPNGSPVTFTASGTAGGAGSIAANSPTSLTATVNTNVATPPSVKVTDAATNPVPNVLVTFTVTGGGGSTVPAQVAVVNTNALGIASLTSWKLGTVAGTNNNTLTATTSSLGPVTFTATATAGLANQVAANSVTSQSAQVSTAVAAPPKVKVTDQFGNAVSGFAVSFAVTAGGGTVVPASPTTVATDVNGIAATTSWTLGPSAGANTVRATAGTLIGSPIDFSATGTAGSATNIASNSVPSQSAIAGTAVSARPSVKVTDGIGNPVQGVVVTFAVTAGGGSITGPAAVATDVSGIATVGGWTLGPTAGTSNNTLTATSGSLIGSPVTFTASGLVGPANIIASNSVTSQSATVSTAVAAPPKVKVTDANNNPVANVPVTFTVTAGGGTIVPASPATVNTDALGIASLTSWTLGSGAGTNNNTVTATAAVPNGSPVTFTASGTAGGAGSIAANSPTSLTATVNTNVATPPSVKVTDAATNPVANVLVTFTVTAGGGSTVPVQVATVNTNALGVASLTSWKLGTLAGSNNNTLTATTSSLGPVTFTATATAGSANQVAANSVTSQSAQVGTAVGAPPNVKVTDQFGNPVQGFAVSFAVTAGGGTVVPAAPTTVATDVNGVAASTSWTLGPSAGANTVRATAGSLIGSPIDFNATGTSGSATNISANSATTQSATAGTAVATPPSVKVTDGVNPVAGVVVTFAVTAGGGSITGPAAVTTNGLGVATVGGWILGPTAGTNNNTLTATSGSLIGSPLTFTASGTVGSATQLGITTQPVGGASGALLATQPVVVIRDAQGNTVITDDATVVTVGIFSGAGGTLSGTLTATANNGVATFTSVTLAGTVGTNYVLRFTSSPVLTPVNSGNVTVTAGTATQLAITTQPVGGASGAVLATTPVVTIRDAQGNTVTSNSTTQVTVTISSGIGGTLGGAVTRTAASGLVTFPTLTLAGTVGVNYVLQFTATPALTAPTSSNVTVTAGAATQLGITTQPVGGASGALLATQPVVVIRDAQGNTVTTDDATVVTVGIFSGASGTLGGTLTATANNGVATFTSVTLAGTAGTNYVLRFTSSPVLTPVNSGNVTVTAGTATQLAITTQPVGDASGGPLATQPVVVIRDAQGNTVITDDATVVTVAIFSGASGTLGGTLTATANNGVATFTSVTLAGTVGTNYVLRFTSSPVLTPANSGNVTVTAGAPTDMSITIEPPASGASGSALTPPTVITVRDAEGNAVGGVSVTVTKESGSGTLSGTVVVVTNASGQASFDNIIITGSGDHTLKFSATGLTDVISTTVNIP